jgi:hypothetical protein
MIKGQSMLTQQPLGPGPNVASRTARTGGRLPSSSPRSERLKPAENKFTQIDFTSFSMQGVNANSHTLRFRKLYALHIKKKKSVNFTNFFVI